MGESLACQLAALRAIVGFLGERASSPWWKSGFFGISSQAFLAPTFPRTVLAARCHGVREAACRVHDEAIGTGRVYHLFRLPEELEQSGHRCLFDGSAQRLLEDAVSVPEKALEYLRRCAVTVSAGGTGPRHVGAVDGMRTFDRWKTVAGFYLYGFDNGKMVLPYFADK